MYPSQDPSGRHIYGRLYPLRTPQGGIYRVYTHLSGPLREAHIGYITPLRTPQGGKYRVNYTSQDPSERLNQG